MTDALLDILLVEDGPRTLINSLEPYSAPRRAA